MTSASVTPSLQAVQLVGIGSYLPEPVLSNQYLSQWVDTTDEWIFPRTGIRERRISPPSQTLVEIGVTAAQEALLNAQVEAQAIDVIILATSTSSDRFGTAPQVQALLGATNALAFDLTAACTGFIYAVSTACQFLRTGFYQRALVVAADVLSRTVDWQDRTTCILFGDGAGAVVLEAADPPQEGILGIELRTDGQGSELLSLKMDVVPEVLGTELQVGQYRCSPIKMNGREVYKFAVTSVPEVIEKSLYRAGMAVSDVNGFFIHQANQRILDAVAERLGVDPARMASVLARYGNTSGASVPIALSDWIQAGQFQTGDIGVMAGFGAGLTWGSIVFRWGRL
jgi:3-oxoacyl-[acyl-carrier-protein] synthase-3